MILPRQLGVDGAFADVGSLQQRFAREEKVREYHMGKLATTWFFAECALEKVTGLPWAVLTTAGLFANFAGQAG